MTTASNNTEHEQPRDAAYWAPQISRLAISDVPAGAVSRNVEGRRIVGPVQGFGQLWQKTYRIKFDGATATPTEVIRVWKEHFPEFQPPQNRFYPSIAGVAPGEVVLINASLQGLPIETGVLVLYADDEAFTLMTPEGHPESGWITFSAYQQDTLTVIQIESLARSNDPIYELGFRVIGSKDQEAIWTHVLTALARHYGVVTQVEFQKICVDPCVQWAQAKNVWQNAGIRSLLATLAIPKHWTHAVLARLLSNISSHP